MSDNNISLTPETLKDIIATAVSEAVKAVKAPSELEQRKLDEQSRQIKQDQENRAKTAKDALQEIENKKSVQRSCTHQHKNGDTHCVYVKESRGIGYLICQKNQCKIRAGVAPQGYKGNDIYDTQLFNQLFQKLPDNELFG